MQVYGIEFTSLMVASGPTSPEGEVGGKITHRGLMGPCYSFYGKYPR
jgi:hypothetical protein